MKPENNMPQNKFLKFLKTAALQLPMNSEPVAMQASGYKPTKEGVEYAPSEGSEKLAENIAIISSVPNTIMNAGMTGIVPLVLSELGGAVGSYAGARIGEPLDEHFGTQ